MKKTLFAAALVAAFTFSACSDSKTENAEATAETHEGMNHEDMDQAEMSSEVVVETPDYSSVAEPFKTQVSELVDKYLSLKDALVASDAGAAKAAADEVLTVAKAMPVATLTSDEKAYAEEKTNAVVTSATTIAGSDDLASQRKNLEPLSLAVFSLAKTFGAAEGTLYYQYCPMAMNNKGAYWVSASEEIANPYFGKSMLTCGSTEEVYKK